MDGKSFTRPETTWARFNYLLLKRTSWVTRRVETWTYVGDAQWCRAFSFDLNTFQIEDIWNEALSSEVGDGGQSVSEALSPLQTAWRRIVGNDGSPEDDVYCVPLFDIDKRQQFTDFDLRDEKGCALHLLMRKVSAQMTVSALIGAMLTEHPDRDDLILSFDEPTTKFLSELFSSPIATCVQRRSHSLSGSEIISEVLADAFRKLDAKIGKDYVRDGEPWDDSVVCKVKCKLSSLVSESPVFRYFLKTYSMKWLACAELRFGSDQPEMIKGKYCVIRDVAKRSKRYFFDDLNPFPRGIPFEIELDGVGVGEVDHTVVQAPAGTLLTPASPIEGLDSMPGRFHIKDDLSVRTDLDVGLADDPEARAWGVLTPGHAAVKTKKKWEDSPNGGVRRRLPVEGSGEHRYLLMLNIAPRLGLRALGHLALLGISAVAFLMVALDTGVASSGNSFSLGSLLVISSLLITGLTNREEESYIRKLLFRLPRVFSIVCVAVDAVGFFYFMVMAALTKTMCEFAAPNPVDITAWAGFSVCCILLIWCLMWTANYAIRKRKWTSENDAFDMFEVGFDAIGECGTVSIPRADNANVS